MRRIRFEQWVLLFVVVVGAVSTSVIGVATLNQSHDGAVAKQALCTFKHDLEQRVDQTVQFLNEHPEGFAGIPAATLRASLKNQQATVQSLASLHCKKGAP